MSLVSASCNVLDQMSHPSWRRRADLSFGGLTACGPGEACASSRMPVPIVEADCPATEQLLLTIGRAGVLSNRAIGAEELDTLLRLLGPPSERQRSDLKRATDIVLVEEGKLIYWPRTGEQFADAAYAMARVQATLAHEHRYPQARAGLAPQLARSSDTSSVRHARRSRRLGRAHRRADARSLAARCAALRCRRGCSSMRRDRAARAQWPRSRPPGRCCRAASPWWSRRRCVSPASCSASSPATSSPPTPPSGARR